ncbi:hypothetical protein TFUB22_01766 [Tannerella forsythia]|uniref:Lipoprotein n=1 Tax=Tannerella forsythia TaxID=28112 RepID=A0A1D3UR57_TANFO|nr:hypothetical protein TFUB20_01794 [Tannerella forsythia]SCQ23856.1 hypothetical protein TFUB22_01766 [Tannerella forsythia]
MFIMCFKCFVYWVLSFIGCKKAFIRREDEGFVFLSRLMYFCGLKKHSITQNGFQKYY